MAKKQEAAGDGAAQVEAYLANAREEHRPALQALRATIAAAAPEAVEGISYGIPGFKYRGKGLAWYADFKAHCSFFPGGTAQRYRAELSGFRLSKGTIQFTPDHPIPADLVTRIVQDRMTEIAASKKGTGY
ncbi:MAG: DUF1801 domain-containing protein [Chloroflexota bacterium]